jgi:ectoine hydroxylase-related dioxygenase (phytanoyl-CoA dioxygenase family)
VLSAATIWAINDFTADNGATVVIPGSHRLDDHRKPTDADERVSVVMPAGSVVFFVGTLWHGGGALGPPARCTGSCYRASTT